MTVPASFTTGAIWESDRAEEAPVLVTRLGIATLIDAKKADQYVPVLIAPDSGKPRWTGESVSATEGELPTLNWVEDGEQAWVVLSVADKDANTVTVYAYNALASHEESPPTSRTVFAGSTPDSLPAVTFTSTGIMVSGSTVGSYLRYHPTSGATTLFGVAPVRGEQPGTPILTSDGGWLVSYSGIGFGYATTAGGWESDSHAPNGAVAGGERVIQPGAGYIVSIWNGEEEGTQVLALQDLQDGAVVASLPIGENDDDERALLEAQTATDAPQRNLVTGGDWVTWGGFAFNLDDESGKATKIADGSPISIIQEMVYVEDAVRPLTGPDSTPKPEPTPTPTGEPSPVATETPKPIKGFSGNVALDLATGTPMPSSFESGPLGISSYGQGIFAYENTIYAVPIR